MTVSRVKYIFQNEYSMNNLLLNMLPLLLLIAFGFILRRIHYFSDGEIQKITGFVGDFLVPCVIFNTILKLDIQREHIALSAAFFCFLCLLLVLSWFIYRIFHIQRRFFIFFSCAFAFGLMGIPLFSTLFGEENMEYLVALGVGHELFIALIYITGMKIVLKGDDFSKRTVLQNLSSPLFYMVFAALILNLTGLRTAVETNVLGGSMLAAISKIASITTVLTMIVVGYRIRFQDKKRIRESMAYVLFRYLFSFGLGYLFKFLVLDRLVQPSRYFDYAFFTMLSQFGSTLLIMLVGEYCSQEELEVSSNAFVINVMVGIVLYVVFALLVGAQTVPGI